MRVAIVTGWFPSLSETFVLNHITGLINLGVEVDIFAFKQGCNVPHQQLKDYRLGERTRYLPVDLEANPSAYAPFLNTAYDAIHCHFGMIAERLAFLKPRLGKTRLFVTFHGLDILAGLEQGGHIYESTFTHSDGVIAISNYNRNSLIEMGCPENKLIDLPNSVDTHRFLPTRRVDENPKKTLRIITIARLHTDKNIPFALEVMKSLKDDGYQFRYSIIGDGDQRETIESLIRRNGLENEVQLLESCSQEAVIAHLRQADLFFLPSQNEAFPVSLLEAQAAGLPVVSTNVGGTSEAISDNHTGYLIQSNDVQNARENLRRLFDDRDLMRAMGKNARSFVAGRFDASAMMERCIRLYRK